MKKIVYIGISGKKRHGKNTAAGAIITELNRENKDLPVYMCALAAMLKERTRRHYGLNSFEELEDRKEEFREALQFDGDFCRKLWGEDCWIKAFEQLANSVMEKEAQWLNIRVVADIRYKNEANWIKSKGGKLIRVERLHFVNDDNHPSETDLDDYRLFDYLVKSETKESLVEQITDITKLHIKPWLLNEHKIRC